MGTIKFLHLYNLVFSLINDTKDPIPAYAGMTREERWEGQIIDVGMTKMGVRIIYSVIASKRSAAWQSINKTT